MRWHIVSPRRWSKLYSGSLERSLGLPVALGGVELEGPLLNDS